MESFLTGLAEHGYGILFAAVFLEAIGLPVPAALALLLAGGASARGSLHTGLALGSALSAMILGDTLMFLMGRYTGWWLLGLLCRVSLNSESCILRSADSFYRRGRILLLFAKFVPGINAMAPPLAGSMNMRLVQFFGLDLVGASLYIGAYFSVGFVFSGALDAITKNYVAFGRGLTWLLILLLASYLGYQVWMWRRARALRTVPFVSPAEAARALSAEGALIYDVRSHGYYDRKAMRAQGSKRLEPNGINQVELEIPAGTPVYLYCTCLRDATSTRVGHFLLEKGVRVAVIQGGLRAWKKAGLPLEPVPLEEMADLPLFD
jgi:membrane protein DedA with SNARE-associated domain/rhodanese-related sulfurtransferase